MSQKIAATKIIKSCPYSEMTVDCRLAQLPILIKKIVICLPDKILIAAEVDNVPQLRTLFLIACARVLVPIITYIIDYFCIKTS